MSLSAPRRYDNFFLSPFKENFYSNFADVDPTIVANVEQNLANHDPFYSRFMASIERDNKIRQVTDFN
jgi:hypothetical protein